MCRTVLHSCTLNKRRESPGPAGERSSQIQEVKSPPPPPHGLDFLPLLPPLEEERHSINLRHTLVVAMMQN